MTESDETQRKTRAGTLGRFLGYIKQRRETVGNGPHLWATIANVRPLVQPAEYGPHPNYNGLQGGNGPQLAPDPVRQSIFDGIGHLGIARVPIWRSGYDQTAWTAQRFVTGNEDYRAGASIPFGHQTPSFERANIDVPSSVAYGSLFTYQPMPYGYE